MGKLIFTALVLTLAGCVQRKPGDKPSNLTTDIYAENDVMYYMVGIKF